MKSRPKVVAFDVVETLFSLEPLRGRLEVLGLAGASLEIWFARLLRNGFALDTSGVYRPFDEVARATLEVLLVENRLAAEASAMDQALAGFAVLPAHDDAAPAFQLLHEAGVRIVALTNGGADSTLRLLERAHLNHWVERVISIDAVRRWKPAHEVYLHAATVVSVPPSELALVAAHAWDVNGASRAGLVTGWVSRLEKKYLPVMTPPDVEGDTLAEICQQLLALPPADHGC